MGRGAQLRFPQEFRARAGAVAWGVQGGQAVVDSAICHMRPLAASARKLVPLSSRITQWWMTRSMVAAILGASLPRPEHGPRKHIKRMSVFGGGKTGQLLRPPPDAGAQPLPVESAQEDLRLYEPCLVFQCPSLSSTESNRHSGQPPPFKFNYCLSKKCLVIHRLVSDRRSSPAVHRPLCSQVWPLPPHSGS